MKTKSIIYIALVSVFFSCKKNEMQLSKSDVSVLTEMENHSPIYIDINEEKIEVNANNKIGNTNWIFHVNKNINLISVINEVKPIVEKKYAEKMHGDSLGVYFSYSDTLQNKLNFLPFRDLNFVMSGDIEHPDHLYKMIFQKNKSFYFKDKMYDFTALHKVVNENRNHQILLVFQPDLSFESYIQIQTKIQTISQINVSNILYFEN